MAPAKFGRARATAATASAATNVMRRRIGQLLSDDGYPCSTRRGAGSVSRYFGLRTTETRYVAPPATRFFCLWLRSDTEKSHVAPSFVFGGSATRRKIGSAAPFGGVSPWITVLPPPLAVIIGRPATSFTSASICRQRAWSKRPFCIHVVTYFSCSAAHFFTSAAFPG